LRTEEERLEAELSYRGALAQAGLMPVSLDDVQASLPQDAALLELLKFSVFDPQRAGTQPWRDAHYAGLVVRNDGELLWFDLGPAAEIDVRADKWKSVLRNRSTDAATRDAAAAALSQLVFEPLRPALSDVRHLLISPDGKLALVPCGPLWPEGDEPTPGKVIVSYLSSGRELLHADEATEVNPAMIVADPAFDAALALSAQTSGDRFADRGKLAPLPGTRQEGEELRQLLRNATLLMDAEATVQAVKQIERPVILHIATHGLFSPLEQPEADWRMDMLRLGDEVLLLRRPESPSLANPMFFSGLALAGASQRADAQMVGILTAQEIAGMDLRGTQLVVLSACETGLGTVKQGEEFTGLRRALAIAGAATQVTSLWKVDDTATRVLMGHYYRLLLEGVGRAEALEQAQRRVRHDSQHPAWSHPFYWAAFISAGDWRPIHVAEWPWR
jgi:CHAT domain-containing protein